MRYLYFIALCLLLSSTSCKKGKANFTLKGTITDATFNGNLTGGTIDLYEVDAGGADITLLGSQTIGSDGAYSFSFPRNASESYIIQIRKDNYFEREITVPFSDLTIEEDNVRNYSTTAKSWAGLRFVTTNNNATLKYTRQQGKSDCTECCPSGEQIINGAVDTIIYCPNDGNTTYSYNYVANGVFGIKNVTTSAFDTTIVTLSY